MCCWTLFISLETRPAYARQKTRHLLQTYSSTDYPLDLVQLFVDSLAAVYTTVGAKLPKDKLKKEHIVLLMLHAWKIVYIYYWSCVTVLILCSLIFMILIRKNKSDTFDWISIIFRALMAILAIGLISVVASDDALYTIISSPVVLPLCVIIIFLILVFDRWSAIFANWRLRKSGAPVATDDSEHGHHEEHDHHDSMDKGAHVGITEHVPLTTQSTAYERPGSIAMQPAGYVAPYGSPPVPQSQYNSNGYAPVQHYG